MKEGIIRYFSHLILYSVLQWPLAGNLPSLTYRRAGMQQSLIQFSLSLPLSPHLSMNREM